MKSAMVTALIVIGCGGDAQVADVCGDGRCQIACWPSWGDCNQDEADGCETELTTDADCGACGAACAGDETCVMGGCGEIIAIAQGYVSAAATADAVVWATSSPPTGLSEPRSTLRSLNLASGETMELAADLGPVGSIAIDETEAYVLHGGGLARLPLAGGELEVISSAASGWVGLDDTHIYWSESSEGAFNIVRAPKAGGAHETLAIVYSTTTLAGVDATFVYLGLDGRVVRVDKEGVLEVEAIHNIGALGGDTDHLDMDLATGIIYVLGSQESEESRGILIAAPTDGSPAEVIGQLLCERGCFHDFGPVVSQGVAYWSARSVDPDAIECELHIATMDLTVSPPEAGILTSFSGCGTNGAGGGVVAATDDHLYLQLPAQQGTLFRRSR